MVCTSQACRQTVQATFPKIKGVTMAKLATAFGVSSATIQKASRTIKAAAKSQPKSEPRV
jgi:DNA-binding MurR/RpiR family transcriptional regulator